MLHQNKKDAVSENISTVKHFVSKFYVDDFGIDYESLISRGIKGLITCLDDFNDKNGVKFSSFASNKIKLEILDEIRRTSSFNKDDLLQVKDYCKYVLDSFQNDFSDDTSFNINLNGIKNKCLISFTAYLDEFLFDSNSTTTNKSILELNNEISSQLSYLEKLILYLFYKEELTYSQINIVLNISTNAIFNIHVIGIYKIREIIKNNTK